MLPKNSSCLEYYAAKQAKREAKVERLRRERERAERLAAQEEVVSLQRKEVEASRRAAQDRKYGYSYRYTAPAVPEKKPEFPERADRTVKVWAYNKMIGAPIYNRSRRTRLPAPMDIMSDEIGNKGFGKLKSVQQTTRWSSTSFL